jgi:hypothetical protein
MERAGMLEDDDSGSMLEDGWGGMPEGMLEGMLEDDSSCGRDDSGGRVVLGTREDAYQRAAERLAFLTMSLDRSSRLERK